MPFTKFLAANGGGSSVTAFLLFHIPLVSRLDRLDSVMKFIEGKQELSRWSSSYSIAGRVETQCKPPEMAAREAYSEG
ncbi:hypothetical protein RHGRI_017365 [Rhododendron griersonianum]|uniref:Uncharacterized protein n=1 Tax=Rhododendron griersonianum TaxID=479676 RepID=A0AAV6JXI7_9ERIC|nr:hypothetical protein RHGRI_017365 [Rhododendron griersonianum]